MKEISRQVQDCADAVSNRHFPGVMQLKCLRCRFMTSARFALLTIPFLALSMQPPTVRAREKTQNVINVNMLSEAQKQALQQAVQAVDSEGKSKAAEYVVKLGSIAKRFDRTILSEKPDPELDRKLAAELPEAVVEAVNVAIQLKLTAVREIAKVLTAEQKKILLAELEKPDANPDLTELVGKVLGDKKKQHGVAGVSVMSRRMAVATGIGISGHRQRSPQSPAIRRFIGCPLCLKLIGSPFPGSDPVRGLSRHVRPQAALSAQIRATSSNAVWPGPATSANVRRVQ